MTNKAVFSPKNLTDTCAHTDTHVNRYHASVINRSPAIHDIANVVAIESLQAKHRGGKLQKVSITVSSKFIKIQDVDKQVSINNSC